MLVFSAVAGDMAAAPKRRFARGGFIMLTPLFLAIGLPAKGIGILIA